MFHLVSAELAGESSMDALTSTTIWSTTGFGSVDADCPAQASGHSLALRRHARH
jgi:hypothetical protein